MMRIAMILSTAMISAIIPIYIIGHGLRAGSPLFIALVCAVIGALIAD